MPKKILYFDTETTGIDPLRNGIIQLAGMIEIDGKVLETFDFKVRPLESEEIDPVAMEVHGITIDEVKSFPDSTETMGEFLSLEATRDLILKLDEIIKCDYKKKDNTPF